MIKLKAIGMSFLITVGPAVVVFACLMMAVPVVDIAFNELFSPLSFLGLICALPIGIVMFVAFWGGIKCCGVVYSNLVIFKVDGNFHTVDMNPGATSSAKLGFVLSLIAFLLMIPISLFIWLASSVVILFSKKRAEFIIENSSVSINKLFLLIIVCVGSLALSCINFGLVALQDLKYSVNNFQFNYNCFEYTGTEKGFGISGEKCRYELKYDFQNLGNKSGWIYGDIVIESENGLKYIIEDKNLSTYNAPDYQPDFDKHIVLFYFYIPTEKEKLNNMLRSNIDDLKITLVVNSSNWGYGWGASRTRTYQNGKRIILKDFGEINGNKPSEENSSEVTIEQKYQEAIILYNNAMYEQALNSFTNLGDYKLSLDYVAQCEDKLFYIKMEKDLINVAGENAILPDNYVLYISYNTNYGIYYKYDYYIGFSADFCCSYDDIKSYLNEFDKKLVNNDYSLLSEGVYKKDSTVIQFFYFEGNDYFTYQAFKI